MAILKPGQLASGSYTISGSFSGSFQGNGAGLNNIPSSAIVGLSSTQIASGAVTASVSEGTGSFTVNSGSSTFMFISSSGNVGIGTTTPAYKLDTNGDGRIGGVLIQDTVSDQRITANRPYFFLVGGGAVFQMNGGRFSTGQYNTTAKFDIKGSGTTSATTALLIQNSAGTQTGKIDDQGNTTWGSNTSTGTHTFQGSNVVALYLTDTLNGRNFQLYKNAGSGYIIENNSSNKLSYGYSGNYFMSWYCNSKSIAISSTASEPTPATTAIFDLQSTTKGFLPPRTDLTSNISTPAQGLITYLTGSANEGLYYYNSGSAIGWHKVLTNSGSQEVSGSLVVSGSLDVNGSARMQGNTTITGNLAVKTTLPTLLASNLSYLFTGVSSQLQGSNVNETALNNNIYWDGTNLRRQITGFCQSLFFDTSGDFQYNNSISGAGGTIPTVNTRMVIKNNGNVLIGTTTDAGFKLDVNGTARITGLLTVGPSPGNFLQTGGSTAVWFSDASNPLRITLVQALINLNNAGDFTIHRTMSSARGVISTNPETFNLAVEGYSRVDGIFNRNLSNVNKSVFYASTNGGGSVTNAPILRYFHAVKGDVTGYTSYRGIEIEDLDSYFGTTSGSVGIGTTNITAKLHISGSSGSALLEIDSPAVNNILFVSGSGRVGIGTGTPAATLDIRGTQIATGSIARTMLISSSLSASANNDILVGLDIVPSFNTGSFTGITSTALRVAGNINPSTNGIIDIGSPLAAFNRVRAFSVISPNALGLYFSGGTLGLQIFATGNTVIQNGGTFTDAGYRLDVNGTARFKDTSSNSSVIIDYATGGYIRVNDPSLGEAIRLRAGGGASWFNTGQNLLIGTTTDAGFKLDVNGTARVSGNTTFGGTIGSGGSSNFVIAAGNFAVNITSTDPNNGQGSLITTGAITRTDSQTKNIINVNNAVTSTAANFNTLNGFAFTSTINQTLGTIRGLYIAPTLTATTDFRAIETTTGSVIFGGNTTVTVTGSATISNVLTLTPQNPLPSGVPTGSFAVSSSVPPKPFFWDGTTWNALY